MGLLRGLATILEMSEITQLQMVTVIPNVTRIQINNVVYMYQFAHKSSKIYIQNLSIYPTK